MIVSWVCLVVEIWCFWWDWTEWWVYFVRFVVYYSYLCVIIMSKTSFSVLHEKFEVTFHWLCSIQSRALLQLFFPLCVNSKRADRSKCWTFVKFLFFQNFVSWFMPNASTTSVFHDLLRDFRLILDYVRKNFLIIVSLLTQLSTSIFDDLLS